MLEVPDDGTPLSHEQLVQLAQARDEAAFALLVISYSPGLARYLSYALKDMARAFEDEDDLAQQTFLKAWKGLPHLEDVSKFKTWLYRIATNLVHDTQRRQKGQGQRSSVSLEQHREAYEPLDEACSPEEEVMARDLVKQALQEIPWKERQCFLLEIGGNLSRNTIAEAVTLSPASVGVYISKASEHFREAYARIALEPRDAGRWESEKGPFKMNRDQQPGRSLRAGVNTLDRRAFFRQAFALSMAFAAPSLQPDLRHITDRLSSTTASLAGEEAYSAAELLAQSCWQLLPHRANRADQHALAHVQRIRHTFGTWFTSSSGSPNVRLAEALSEVTLVEGWLLHALDREREAEHACRAAIRLAHDIGNLQLEAIELTWLSNFLIDTGQAHLALAPIQAARQKAAKAGASPLVRASMAATEADVRANQREEYRAAYYSEVALEQAAALTPSHTSEPERYPVPYDAPWLYGYRGAVYSHLGQDAKIAQRELEQGLIVLGSASAFREWGFYHDLIIAHSLGKQVEQACHAARLAMTLAEQTQAPIFLRRVQNTVQQVLGPWKKDALMKDVLEEVQLARQRLAAAGQPVAWLSEAK